MDMWKNIALTLGCVFLLCACGKTVSPANSQSTVPEQSPMQTLAETHDRHLQVSESEDKTTVDIPVQPGVQVYAEYAPKRVSIAFVPAVRDFALPVSGSSLVQSVEKNEWRHG